MRKRLLCALAFGVLLCTAGLAQIPQVNNSGFENWDNLGTNSVEPQEWNSFMTADANILTQFGKKKRVDRSTKVRPGTAGSYSAVIWSTSEVGIVANGNLTCGKINMGSTTPSSSDNYNFTKTSDMAFAEALGGRPDSLVVWLYFKPVSTGGSDAARIHAVIHDTYDVRDPANSNSLPHIVGDAALNFTGPTNQWVRKSIPFTYSGPATDPNYILISFTTNAVPGGGTAGDSLYIDDFQLIYNPPVAGVSNTPACGTGSVTVTSDKSGTQTFELCDNSGNPLLSWSGNATSHTFNGVADGIYRGRVTWNTLVSALSSPTTLTNTAIPTAGVNATPGCNTGSVIVTSTVNANQTFYLCDQSGATLSTWAGVAASHEFTGLIDANYTGKADNGGCMSGLSAPVTLTNDLMPNAFASSTPGCGSGSVSVISSLTGTQTFYLCDAGGNVLQSWTGNASYYEFINQASGDYTGYVVSGSCTSSLSSATTLTNSPGPLATIASTPDCDLGSVTITSDQNTNQVFYLCDVNGNILDSWSGTDISHTFTGLNSGDYKGKVDIAGCVSALSATESLANYITPAILSQPADTLVCENLDAAFAVTDDGNAISFQWQVNAGGIWTDITAAGSNPVYGGYTTATLSLSGVIMANDGLFYRCIVGNTGCDVTSDSAELMVDLCTGIDQENQQESIQVFPNPFSSSLTISLSSSELYTAEVFSVDGRSIFRTELQGGTHLLSTGNWPRGVYMLNISSESELRTLRIVKQ